MKRLIIVVLCLCSAFSVFSGAKAEEEEKAVAISEYPSKPVKIVVTWGAGGGNDRRFRILSSVMNPYLGQPLVVVNRPGGTGTVATQEVASASPDGYTLLVYDTVPMCVVPVTLEVPYDPVNDFEYVLGTHAYTRSIAAGIDAPFDDWPGFIEYAKEHPGEIRFGLGDGAMGAGQLWVESVLSQVGAEVIYVPFDSSSESAAAAAGGHVELSIGTIPSAESLVEQGKLVPILNTYNSDEFGYPGLARYGLEEFEYAERNGVCAPKGTPEEIIEKLVKAFREALNDPSYMSLAKRTGELPVVLSGPELKELTDKMTRMFRETFQKLQQ